MARVRAVSNLIKPNSELAPEALEIRQDILALEAACMAMPEEQRFHQLPLTHHFTDGIYVRTCMMRAGEIVIGKIHKLEHTVIISMGSAQVTSEEFGDRIISAPMVFVSPPGVKRALLIEEDMIWSTVHPNPTNTQDLAELEKQLIMESYEEGV